MPHARHPTLDRFDKMLEAGPVLLSGGFGTELTRRGIETRLPLWAGAALLDDPRAVLQLHFDYIDAGAQILTANTFRTDPHAVAAAGRSADPAQLTRLAVSLAQEAAASAPHPVLVAGSVGPVRDCYAPEDVPPDAVLTAEHGARIDALASAGADLVLVETMNTIREAVAALEACQGRLPAMVSFVCDETGRLLSGEPIHQAVFAVEPFEPLAILVNCCAPSSATVALGHILASTTRPAGIYANGQGRPDDVHGWRFEGGVADAEYVRLAPAWVRMGARLVGGCCGTGPDTIRALRDLLSTRDRDSV